MSEVEAPQVSEEIRKLSEALYEKITVCSVRRVALERVRKDRSAPGEAVSDAAVAFRASEREVNEALAKLIDQQCKELHAVAVE